MFIPLCLAKGGLRGMLASANKMRSSAASRRRGTLKQRLTALLVCPPASLRTYLLRKEPSVFTPFYRRLFVLLFVPSTLRSISKQIYPVSNVTSQYSIFPPVCQYFLRNYSIHSHQAPVFTTFFVLYTLHLSLNTKTIVAKAIVAIIIITKPSCIFVSIDTKIHDGKDQYRIILDWK